MVLLDILFYLFYVATCVTCLRYANNEFSSPISITSMFTFPYLCICTFQEVVCLSYNYFVRPSAEYWFINTIFIIITLLIEICLTRIAKTQSVKEHFYTKKTEFPTPKSFYIFSALLVFYVVYCSIRMLGTIDMSMLLQDDFQDDYGESAGGNFYIRLVTIIFAVYYLGIGQSKWEYLLGILCFFPHIIVNTKGILLIPIIAIIITRILLGRIVKLKKALIFIAAMGLIIFMFSYLLENIIYQQEISVERLQFLCEKMIVYLISGVQEFYVNLRDSVSHNPMLPNITIAPLNNLLAKLGIGYSISNVNNEFNRFIGILPHYGSAFSNVNGYIGTLYIFNGLFGSIIYHILLVIVAFIIKVNALYKQKPFGLILYALFMSGFFLGWFEFYFMHTFWTYFIILTAIIEGIYKLSNTKYLMK